MEYQKILNLLDSTPYQPIKLWTKNWVEVNDGSHGMYSLVGPIKFKTSMIRPSLCDYSDNYIFVKGTMTVPSTGIEEDPNNGNKYVIFKNCPPVTDCISEINNKKIDHGKEIDAVMPMFNLM